MSKIDQHYAKLFAEHGDDPRAVQLTDQLTQRRRFTALLDIMGGDRRASMLDVGCGLAHLHEFALERAFEGQYIGTDVTPAFVDACRSKFPDAAFFHHDASASALPARADYVLLSGVFNNPHEDATTFMQNTLRHMYNACDVGIAFNANSTYVDYFDGHLNYFDPGEIFRWCAEHLSPRVSLRQDYLVRPGVLPYEFVVYVYKSDIECRSHRPTQLATESA